MQSTDATYHTPVLAKQSVEGLQIFEGGIYVDVTFGGGGHAWEIYRKLSSGKLIAFDQDPDASRNIGRFQSDAHRSFLFVPANFQYLSQFLKFHKVNEVDGILADLGVSSHQFDAADRGFSIRFEGKLDMRMDQKRSLSAIQVINDYTEAQLVHVFSFYGEIKNARTLASAIIRERQQAKIETTKALRAIATTVAPKGKEHKYLAQLFQAVRMEVNDEIGALKSFLEQTTAVLKPGGRLVVISYHSLEDRLVKDFMSAGNFKGKVEKDFYGNVIRPFTPVTKKPILPDVEEIGTNNRARSAKLRIATRN